MPWSPIKYFPQIIENLRKNGYTKEVTIDALTTEVMRETGLIRDYSIKQAIKAMERLGYVRHKGNGVFEILKSEGDGNGGSN